MVNDRVGKVGALVVPGTRTQPDFPFDGFSCAAEGELDHFAGAVAGDRRREFIRVVDRVSFDTQDDVARDQFRFGRCGFPDDFEHFDSFRMALRVHPQKTASLSGAPWKHRAGEELFPVLLIDPCGDVKIFVGIFGDPAVDPDQFAVEAEQRAQCERTRC